MINPIGFHHAGGPYLSPSTTQPFIQPRFNFCRRSPVTIQTRLRRRPSPPPFMKIRTSQPHTDSLSILKPDSSLQKSTARVTRPANVAAAMAAKLDKADNLQAYLMQIGVARRRLRQAGGGSSLISSLEPFGSSDAHVNLVSGENEALEDRESRLLVEEKDNSILRNGRKEGHLIYETAKEKHSDQEIDEEPTLAVMLNKTKNLKRRETDGGNEHTQEPTLAVMLKKTKLMRQRRIDRGKEQPQESTLADMLSRTIETKLLEERIKASAKNGKAKFKSMSSIIHSCHSAKNKEKKLESMSSIDCVYTAKNTNWAHVDIVENRSLMETKRLIKQARKSRTDEMVKEQRMNSLLDVIARLDDSNATTSSIDSYASKNGASPIVPDR